MDNKVDNKVEEVVSESESKMCVFFFFWVYLYPRAGNWPSKVHVI